jgi:hypothetical protein
MIYSLYKEGIHNDNSDGLSFTLVTLSPSSICPLNHLPTPLKAIARDFFVLFHIGIWSPPTIYPHLNLFPSPSTHLYLPTHYTYFTVLLFIINQCILYIKPTTKLYRRAAYIENCLPNKLRNCRYWEDLSHQRKKMISFQPRKSDTCGSNLLFGFWSSCMEIKENSGEKEF